MKDLTSITIWCTIIGLFFFTISATAQVEVKQHQHFTITDDIAVLTINVPANTEVEYKSVKGNRIQMETIVKMSTHSEVYASFVKESGRYDYHIYRDEITGIATLNHKVDTYLIGAGRKVVGEKYKIILLVPASISMVKINEG